MESWFWTMFMMVTGLKILLTETHHSTDFEVHRNWLAITYNLPLERWYFDETSQWTLDYPPFFAYFEWFLAQFAPFIDAKMLRLDNHNYASKPTIYFQRGSVIIMDVIYAFGVLRCIRALKIQPKNQKHFAAEVIFLTNVGLLLVDHIHFQYNGMLFGLLLLSISFILESRPLLSAFTFAVLLNFKHIFLYMAPAFGVYFLKFYCMDSQKQIPIRLAKLIAVTIAPFIVAFGPFWRQLPQVFSRLFPFKRGLTHAYWAPNFWAIYNTVDKVASRALNVSSGAGTTSGLVQEFQHNVLPTVTPSITFLLTAIFMLPVLIKLAFYTSKSETNIVFLRSVVLCAITSYMFGWHVHEKAIILFLIPLSILFFLKREDGKFLCFISFAGYWSLFPLIFETDLLLVRYSLFMSYVSAMYGQFARIYDCDVRFHMLENIYIWIFTLLPIYEHILGPLSGLKAKYPFMHLLLTSFYCSLGIIYFFVRYYWYTLDVRFDFLSIHPKTKTSALSSKKAKLKQKRK